MNIHDEASALRHLATVLVAQQDRIPTAHAENRVMAAIKLAEAFAHHSGVGAVAWTMDEMTDAGWSCLAHAAGLTKNPSESTRSLTVLLVKAEGL